MAVWQVYMRGVSLLGTHVSVALVRANLSQHKKQNANQPWLSMGDYCQGQKLK